MMLRALPLGLCLLAGCALGEPPVPPVAPGPGDLSTWGTPELVEGKPERPHIRPQRLLEPKPTAAEKVYAFVPGGTYAAPVSVQAPLDIQFLPGEDVLNVVDSGIIVQAEGQHDGVGPQNKCRQWCFPTGVSGRGEEKRGHVFVTVAEVGLKNGLTITTTQGVYAVLLESVKQTPIRYLRWTHVPPPVEVMDIEPVVPGPLPRLTGASQFRVGYQAKAQGTVPVWMPQQVVDDGKKVYIIFPESLPFRVSPLFRVIGPNGPMPQNSRQYLNILIVDQLFGRAELRLGTGEAAELVSIESGGLRIVDCPDDPACPHWPMAAYALQGGQS